MRHAKGINNNMKKSFTIIKPSGSLPDDWPRSVEAIPKYSQFAKFRDQLISEKRIIKWERSDTRLEIEVDNEATWKDIMSFSNSLGNWRMDYKLVDSDLDTTE